MKRILLVDDEPHEHHGNEQGENESGDEKEFETGTGKKSSDRSPGGAHNLFSSRI